MNCVAASFQRAGKRIYMVAEDVVFRRALSPYDLFPFNSQFISLQMELTNVKGKDNRTHETSEVFHSLRGIRINAYLRSSLQMSFTRPDVLFGKLDERCIKARP